ncbi:response regulator [Gammaproteobacteria bacterium LSUCC0112]|nr:response regulator [Gammaproteobacteria bacterium LSUCC0112]
MRANQSVQKGRVAELSCSTNQSLLDILWALRLDDQPQDMLQLVANRFFEYALCRACFFIHVSPPTLDQNQVTVCAPTHYNVAETLDCLDTNAHAMLASLEQGAYARLQTNTLDLLAFNVGAAGLMVLTKPTEVTEDYVALISGFAVKLSFAYLNCLKLSRVTTQNERLSLATKAGGIGTWELDATTRQLQWDEQMFRLYEVQHEDFSGTYAFFESIVHSEDAPRLLAFIDTYLSSEDEGPIDYQFRIVTPGGITKKIAGYANKVKHKGEHQRLIGVNYDISELETARTQSLYRSQLESLLIELSMKVIRSGPDDLDDVTNQALEVVGKFVGADRSYCFSYDFDAHNCSNTHEWCNEGIEPEIHNLQGTSLNDIDIWVNSHKRGLPMYVTRVFDLPDGHGLKVILAPQGIRSIVTIPLMEGNQCTGFIGFDSVRQERHWNEVDISLLKLLAELLVNAKIKAQNELTIRNTQEELIRSRDTARFLAREAASASVAKSRFVASVSHEIRTPLHAILGLADLALQKTDDDELIDDISTIRKAGSTLLELIDDVLDYSRAEANELSIKTTDFSLKVLAETLTKMFRPLADQKSIALLIECESGIPENLHGDHLRIKQILSNLLSNAIKFTKRGSVNLQIRLAEKLYCHTNQQELVSVKFEVKDTGIGIAESELDKIFDPFYQAEDPRYEHLSGTGLGLPIAKLLAQKMGGSITVESQPDNGAKFTVNMTLRIGNPTKAETRPLHSAKDSLILGGFKILLAEDNPINQQLVKAYLMRSGCQLDIVANGEAVLETRLKNSYNIILMDCQMPKLDGFQTTKIIRRQEERGQHIPIIAVTASAMEGDRETCLQAGMDDVLTKPFSKEELLSMISKHTEARGM